MIKLLSKLKNNFATLAILLILVLGASLRTYKLSAPLADWHSWRQADTASVANEYVKHGIDLFHPKYLDLSSIPSGLDNPEGHRFVEFPFVNALHAYLASTFPQFTLVEWGRILAIFSSTLCILFIYLIMNHVSSPIAALTAALVYATLPYNLFYGRVILPEPHLVLFSLISLYSFLHYWNTGKLGYWITSFLSLALALLLKPTSLIILLPMGFYALTEFKKISSRLIPSLLLPALALIPYYYWRKYVSQFPEGIPANAWLFNGNGIRFKGAWFRWLFGDRIARLILGYWGLLPFGYSLLGLGRAKKELAIVGGMLLGALAYMAIIATGNVQHDYYQIQIIPAIAMTLGVGVDYALSLHKSIFSKITAYCVLITAYLLALALGWYDIRGYFNINNPAIVAAGQKIDQVTTPNALIIAPYQGDTAFLFQTNRRGWPIGGEIDKKIKMGASYYVTTTRDAEYNEVKAKYQLLNETDQYSIIQLIPNRNTGVLENRSTKQ